MWCVAPWTLRGCLVARDTRDILFRMLMDTRDAERGSRKTADEMQQLDRKAGGLTGSMTGVAKAATAVAGALAASQVAQWGYDAIQMATAAAEVESKFQAVYGANERLTDSLREWGDVAGVTETQGKNLAATFGNLAQAQGISADRSADLALDVASLAGDMASFNDADPSQVFDDLNKALLTTEREGMKKYGIAITEAEVKTRAAEIAAADGRTEVTKADRAYASYAIAVQQAGKAVGDLERTSGSTANKQRQLSATVAEFQEMIGTELLPVFEDFLDLAVDAAPALKTVAKYFGLAADTAGELSSSLAILGGNMPDFGDLIQGFLKVNSGAYFVIDAIHDLITTNDDLTGSMSTAFAVAANTRDQDRHSSTGWRNGVVSDADAAAAAMEDAADRIAYSMEDAAARAGVSTLTFLGHLGRIRADIARTAEEARRTRIRLNLEAANGVSIGDAVDDYETVQGSKPWTGQ